jgi:CubicO group peptidase (beta-lactamase class C family)
MRFSSSNSGWAVAVSVCAWLCVALFVPCRAADLGQLLKNSHVPGLAYAVIRGGKIVDVKTFGVRDATSMNPVDEHTVFEVASLSKPVFAYAVLQLVDSGVLSLDDPLSKYVPDYVKGDPRAALVTVGDVLSQTSGLQNWRSKTSPLKTYFAPGSRFSYSGEGFIWLQRVVVAITGETLNDLMARLVFDPLEMKRSSYIWRSDFEADYAMPHDAQLTPGNKKRPAKPRVASTLHTTAADYARFLQAVLSGARLRPATAAAWLKPQIRLYQRCIECVQLDTPDADQHVAWGLGWGLEPGQGLFFHWGDNGGFKAFVVGSVATQSAVVVFTNGSNGMAIMPDIISQLMPGENPAFAWLNYDRISPAGGWFDWLHAH